MRTIKFRAWNIKEKKMYYPDNTWALANGSIAAFDSYGSHLELMQFTGLLDKAGKEIYEGDVVRKHKEVSEDYGFCTLEVRWNVARACFELYNGTPEDYTYLYKTEEKLEVIGNIYENPELTNG